MNSIVIADIHDEDKIVHKLKEFGQDFILLVNARGTKKGFFSQPDEKTIIMFSCNEEEYEKTKLFCQQVMGSKKRGVMFELQDKGDKGMNELILAIVSEGYSEEIIETARKAGATGATVVSARGTGAEFTSLFGMNVGSQKEIILCVTEKEQTATISEAISKNLNKKGKASGMCFSMPISNYQKFNITKK